jgi:dipeptidase D
MSTDIRNLEPQTIWSHFADLNAVPRPSKHEERVIEFMRKFGESLRLPTYVDETGNVIIRKKASPGMEKRIPVVLQGHLDMVHQKNAGTEFDFRSEGIRMQLEGDWVSAEGTTLGADNGIGVAAIMAILASQDIPHPPLEALFTVDEETGMTGAKGLKGGLLHGRIMLNLDTEEDHELTIGCAGGVDVTARGDYRQEPAPAGHQAFRLMVSGLTGGHSGMDIHLGRGNANKIMNRLLHAAFAKISQLRLAQLEGGGLRNAIPRESVAVLTVPEKKAKLLMQLVDELSGILAREYKTTDPGLKIQLSTEEMPAEVVDIDFQNKLLRAVYACPNGIYRMSPDIHDLVQTSSNLARVQVKAGKFECQCLTRSSVDSEKMDMAEAIRSAFELTGAKVAFSNEYPGWTPNPHATIVELMSNLYREMFRQEPKVDAVHAGLECGIVGTNYPGMEMISFGPNIRGAHSPDEKVQVSSVQKFWTYLLATLNRIPEVGR